MIKAIIFDMDGVLLDSEPLHDDTTISILESFGISHDEAYEVLRPFVGRSSVDLWSSMIAKYNLDATVDELVNRQWKKNVASLPTFGIDRSAGLTELIQYAEEHDIKMGVASSSRGDFVEAVFDHLKLWPHIECMTSGLEVENGKPMPDIFLLSATKMDVEPERCLVIEDSTAGVQAGKMAGMYTIGYDNPTSAGQNVTAADRVVKRLDEVIEIIDSLSTFRALPVTTPTQIACVASLAHVIWNEYFPSVISNDQINYMLNKFQSMPAIENAIRNEGYSYYIAMLGDSPIGYMGLSVKDDAAFLSKIYLLKAFRGDHLSKPLFQLAVDYAKNNGKNKLRLTVNRNNQASIDIYKAKGFKVESECKADIGDGFFMDDFVMTYEIS